MYTVLVCTNKKNLRSKVGTALSLYQLWKSRLAVLFLLNVYKCVQSHIIWQDHDNPAVTCVGLWSAGCLYTLFYIYWISARTVFGYRSCNLHTAEAMQLFVSKDIVFTYISSHGVYLVYICWMSAQFWLSFLRFTHRWTNVSSFQRIER